MTSGALKSEGTLPENTRLLNSTGMGSDFHLAVDPWGGYPYLFLRKPFARFGVLQTSHVMAFPAEVFSEVKLSD